MENETFTTRALTPADWEDFRRIRLEGLQKHVSFFGAKYADEAKRTPEEWQKVLSGDGKYFFGLFQGGKMIGATGIRKDKFDPLGKTLVLIASYIEDEYRGRGLSDLLYRVRLAWMLAQPQFDKIVTSHRASNEASRKANQKYGFRFTHKSDERWPDGEVEEELFYELSRDEVAKALAA